jgi:hypothetical protein
MDAMAEDSFALARALIKPGMAITAMMVMIETTIIISTRVKPLLAENSGFIGN